MILDALTHICGLAVYAVVWLRAKKLASVLLYGPIRFWKDFILFV